MNRPVLPIAPAGGTSSQPLSGWPVLRLGFRPFYLGAAALAAISVPLWIAMHLGHLQMNVPMLPLLWHAHEMLYGFAVAVIIGFLLTAGKSWTGLPTPRGPALGALASLWLAARLAAFGAPHLIYAVLDLALLPIVAVVFLRLLIRAGNRRNLPIGGILVLLSLSNLAFHLSVAGWLPISPLQVLHAALGLIVMIECVIAGRVIPVFTVNVTPGLKIEARPRLEQVTLGVTALALLMWVTLPANPANSLALGAAAVLHALRLAHWQSWVTRDRPILWILHAAYLWMPLGFALLGAAQWGFVSVSAGVHALAVGVTGGLIIGMITRTARGHTGRAMKASRPEVIAYLLVMGAALARVFLPVLWPQALVLSLVTAAVAWSLAFVLYLFVYTPWLLATRLDGKDG
jgi:uncharacterized protein involved in response to NO